MGPGPTCRSAPLLAAAILIASARALDESLSHASEDGLEARARREYERRAGSPYPGMRLGGRNLQCGQHDVKSALADTPLEMQRPVWIVATLSRLGASFPLSNSLEIGPCDKPLRLPGAVVTDQATLDWEPGANGLECNGMKPTFVDDAQHLRQIFDGAYDLIIAAHALEHLADVLRALRNWLRVLRPGGHAVIFLPDACSPAMMDRSRLAMPAEHFVSEFASGTLERHEDEIAVSTLRFHRLFNASKHFAPEAGHQSIAALTPTRLASQIARNRKADANGRGHVHVWSSRSLQEMLEAAQELLDPPFRLMELGSWALPSANGVAGGNFEFRFVLQRLSSEDAASRSRQRALQRTANALKEKQQLAKQQASQQQQQQQHTVVEEERPPPPALPPIAKHIPPMAKHIVEKRVHERRADMRAERLGTHASSRAASVSLS